MVDKAGGRENNTIYMCLRILLDSWYLHGYVKSEAAPATSAERQLQETPSHELLKADETQEASVMKHSLNSANGAEIRTMMLNEASCQTSVSVLTIKKNSWPQSYLKRQLCPIFPW